MTNYRESFNQLTSALISGSQAATVGDVILFRVPFLSPATHILPGNSTYFCPEHQLRWERYYPCFNEMGADQKNVRINDSTVHENSSFDYLLMEPNRPGPLEKIVLILHGLNEKSWEKYLPWGRAICQRTGYGVLFFPIAFHMGRAPLQWSEKRAMYKLCQERKQKFPDIREASLSNVAISTRLHANPQRFIWSGLQTYYDVIHLIERCRAGDIPHILPAAEFHLLGYSIGAFLSQILKLANHKNYFSNSKVCLFCGGPVFAGMTPVSKFIIDSEADAALRHFLSGHFNGFIEKDPVLAHFTGQDHTEGMVFRAMLQYDGMKKLREKMLSDAAGDIYGITLAKDEVMRTTEVKNTLQASGRDLAISVDEFDFPYDYIHENPFPLVGAGSELVTRSFNLIFDCIAGFFARGDATRSPREPAKEPLVSR